MISYEVRHAIEALPGKTVQPWKDGDERCHCTHCDLCGRLFRTAEIGKHIDECQAALIAALERGALDEDAEISVAVRDLSTADRFISAAIRAGVGTTTELNIMAQFCEQKLLPLISGRSKRLVVVQDGALEARHVGGPSNPLAFKISRSLDSAQIQALRAIYGTKTKGGRRVWAGTTWNGMYNGLAGHGLCRVRKLSGARTRYTAIVTKLGRAVKEAWDGDTKNRVTPGVAQNFDD